MRCPAAVGGPLPWTVAGAPQHRQLVVLGHGEGSVGYATCPSPEMMVTRGRGQGLSTAVIKSPAWWVEATELQMWGPVCLVLSESREGWWRGPVPGRLGRGKAPVGLSQLPTDAFCTQIACPPLSWVHTATWGGVGEERSKGGSPEPLLVTPGSRETGALGEPLPAPGGKLLPPSRPGAVAPRGDLVLSPPAPSCTRQAACGTRHAWPQSGAVCRESVASRAGAGSGFRGAHGCWGHPDDPPYKQTAFLNSKWGE